MTLLDQTIIISVKWKELQILESTLDIQECTIIDFWRSL
jgi:hypothetical protein